MPLYNIKYRDTMSREQFFKLYQNISKPKHRAFALLLYLTGCRISEILALTPSAIMHDNGNGFDVRIHRLKGSSNRHNILRLPLDEYSNVLYKYSWQLPKEELHKRIFSFNRRTGHRYIRKYFDRYPHFFRMNRATWILNRYGIDAVLTWFGWKIKSAGYYIADAKIQEIGMSLE